MSNPLKTLNQLGHSIWYDNIERKMLGEKGELARMIEEDDLRGVTSNPAIYEKAITQSNDYDADIQTLKEEGLTPREIFFKLAVDDIQKACDLFRETYEKTDYHDGYVSLEVSPDLAYDTEGTIQEALQLWQMIDRPNAMIKIPATKDGIQAIERLTAEGININVTLIFSVERYIEVANAYIRGLKTRVDQQKPINQIASVASFFISRLDSKIDPLVALKAPELKGKVAIANAQRAFIESKELFLSDLFNKLRKLGAQPQRLLWASTGVKDPDYDSVIYINKLAFESCVNTVPPVTYNHYRNNGIPKIESITRNQVEDILNSLIKESIDINLFCKVLEEEGITQFENAFDFLLKAIDKN